MKKVLLKMLAVVLCLGYTASLHAQGITTAAMHGKVIVAGKANAETGKSAEGEVMPGVVVIAVHLPSGTQYTTATNEKGKFNIQGMRIGGPYKITTSFIGYKSQPKENIFLELGDNYEVNPSLVEESTELSEVVVKAGTDNIMNSDRTGAGTNVRKEQFERLPSVGRSFQDFTALTPQAGSNFSFGGRNNLYNNLAIDGSTLNNAYGLQALPGSQTSANAIGLDAIQEMKISISPYDVRQGNFTGAAINAVTRSGTNEFSGSIYSFGRNQDLTGSKVSGVSVANGNYSFLNSGFRLGGPIIKNKVFFFVNYEAESRTRPGSYYTASTKDNPFVSATATPSISQVKASDLDTLRNFLLKNYGYDPGRYQGFDITNSSKKILAKVDWNINKNHKLTVRYNSLISAADVPPNSSGSPGTNPAPSGAGRGEASSTYMPFENSFYTINNNSYSIIAELNSRFGNMFSNNLQAGVTFFRDFRTSKSSPFPMVDFYNSNNTPANNYTSIGYEPFTYGNTLNQDVYQFNDNFNIYFKDHVITLGTSNEFYRVYNYFYSQYYGTYRYEGTNYKNGAINGGIQQFINNSSPISSVSGANTANAFIAQYVPLGASPAVEVKAGTFGFFAQDEYSGFKNLKLTLGLRVDVPTYFTDLPANPRVDSLTYANGEKISVSKLPSATPLFSPRIGFNWDVKGDKTFQIRGGTGIFTGRIPLVWAGNQGNSNGISLLNDQTAPAAFDPNKYLSYQSSVSTGIPSSVTIAVLGNDFKWPQVWRTSLGIDKKLPWGMIGTLEGIFTQDVNAISMVNVALNNPIGTTSEGRDLYDNGNAKYSTYNPSNNTAFARQVLVLKNTGKGYSWSLTGQLQKTFSKNWYASIAYTHTESRDLNTSFSTASSGWTGNYMVGNPNTPQLANSQFLTPDRIVAQASYRVEYSKHFASTISLTYIGSQGTPFSYTVGGDPINSGNNGQQLMYIPKDKNDIVLAPSASNDTRTPDQIWAQLDAYISQDPYLSSHRGQFAARNGAFRPWINSVNFRFLQDIFTNIGTAPATPEEAGYSYKGKRNSIQISFEIQNFLNFLNSGWGIYRNPYTGNSSAGGNVNLINFVGYENPAIVNSSGNTVVQSSGRPIYQFGSTTSIPTSTYIDDVTLNSRYQIQIGLRYTFN
jgi:hypothetical protein